MWSSSGLHYAANSALAGDGAYQATITVGVPAFARAPSDKARWDKPMSATYHFEMVGGKVVEVTAPAE